MIINHFLELDQVAPGELKTIIQSAIERKTRRSGYLHGQCDSDRPLQNCVLALIFAYPSTRTRISFEVGMRQLGGQTLMLTSAELQLGRGETIADTAKVLSRYVDIIMIRTGSHLDVEELAQHASVPVINGLTHRSHPCQIMADIMTFQEKRGSIEGRTVLWSGDGNNVCHSWIQASAVFNFTLNIACPQQLRPDNDIVEQALKKGGKVRLFDNLMEAAQGADCVITDTWVSMGDDDSMRRNRMLQAYQIDSTVMQAASSDALFMHCLPAHRGQEVTAQVFDGSQSAVFDEAENRLHVQKEILLWCLGSR